MARLAELVTPVSPAFCYIHLGPKPPPGCLFDSIYQTQAWNPETPIYVVLDQVHASAFEAALAATRIERGALVLVLSNTLKPTAHHGAFRANHTFNEDYRHGFWRHTTERFFVLEELMESFRLRDVIHLENDVLIYFSLGRLLPAFQRHGPMAVTRDAPHRVVPGIMYIADPAPLRSLNFHLSAMARHALHDMNAISLFQAACEDMVRLLPIMMPDYDRSLAAKSSHGFEDFQSLFDAAAIGQYLGGIDLSVLDNDKDREDFNHFSKVGSVGFVNNQSVFDCRNLDFAWQIDEASGPRRPSCRMKASDAPWIGVNNLHLHSKVLHNFSSRLWIGPENLITGERLQGLTDISVAPKAIVQFHRDVDKYARAILRFNDYTRIGHDLIHQVGERRSLFIYTDAIDGFLQNIWPRLQGRGYVLVTHNSDHEIGERFLPWLDAAGDKLDRWFAQNVTIAHPKLVPLPIGIANSMEPHGDLGTLHDRIAAWDKMRKTQLVYLQFNLATHPARRPAWDKLRSRFPQLLAEPPAAKPFGQYLDELAIHQFCVCPRGSGIDTHRVWESLYLGVIPIVERSLHTEHWQKTCGVPMVLVDDWLEVTEARLADEYPRLVELLPRGREHLTLEYYWRMMQPSCATTVK